MVNNGEKAAPQLRLVSDRVELPPQDTRSTETEWSILMRQSQGGDSGAYRQLLGAISPYVRSLARNAHRDLRDVEDTVQDVLTTIHQIRSTYDPRRPFGPWLKAIASRRIADSLRRVHRRQRLERTFTDSLLDFAAPESEPEERSLGITLADLIARLSPGEAEALTLTKLQGLSLAEAAARSGHSVTALKAAVHRAIGKLRKLSSGRQE